MHNNVSWDLTWIMPLVISVKTFLDRASQTSGSYRSLSNLSCTLSYFSHYLWNRNILSFFKPSRDLLKGDPPSPYIFIISMGKLSNITYDFVRSDSWKSICIFLVDLTYHILCFSMTFYCLPKPKSLQLGALIPLF